MNRAYDVIVIGSGFGGSLTGLILSRLGYRVAILDRRSHPRFAIGESSTPLADQTLHRLAERFHFPWLSPLSRYGTARCISDIVVGAKRGFSYFQHQPDAPFDAGQKHQHELLVAASSTTKTADTHWHRGSVDAWFASHLEAHQVDLFENCHLETIDLDARHRWLLSCTVQDAPIQFQSHFVIDATGRRGLLLDHLNIPRRSNTLRTRTRAIYGHFADVTPWHQLLDPALCDDHPFPCDQAAVHHLIDEGWMWQLGFDHGVTSCGIVFAGDDGPSEKPLQHWNSVVARYPTLQQQFASSRLVAPRDGLVSSGRLQSIADRCAGDHWLCLPATAGFVDPLHSTGIAHTVTAIESIADMFSAGPTSTVAPAALQRYNDCLLDEIRWVDRLVSTCYAARVDFELFVVATMLYFAAATYSEQTGDPASPKTSFLGADNKSLRQAIDSVADRIHGAVYDKPTPAVVRDLTAYAVQTLEPFNQVGLFAPPVNHMYSSTAADGS